MLLVLRLYLWHSRCPCRSAHGSRWRRRIRSAPSPVSRLPSVLLLSSAPDIGWEWIPWSRRYSHPSGSCWSLIDWLVGCHLIWMERTRLGMLRSHVWFAGLMNPSSICFLRRPRHWWNSSSQRKRWASSCRVERGRGWPRWWVIAPVHRRWRGAVEAAWSVKRTTIWSMRPCRVPRTWKRWTVWTTTHCPVRCH